MFSLALHGWMYCRCKEQRPGAAERRQRPVRFRQEGRNHSCGSVT